MEIELKSEKEVDQKPVIEISEEVIEETPEIDLSGLSSKEKVLAEKHGIKETEKKDGEHKVDTSITEKGVEAEKKEEVVEVPTFEDIENNETHLEKFNPNEKALYWKWKNDKRKRQDAQKRAEELQARLELETVKDRASGIKIKRLKEFLSNPSDDLTVEKLLGIIDSESIPAETEDTRPLTKADLDKIEQDKRIKLEEQSKQTNEQKQRLAIAEKIGLTKYANFNELVELAKEAVAEDKSGTYQEILDEALNDPNYDEEKLVDRVATIAKLSKKYGKQSVNGTESKDKVEKVVENSKKKISSASISSSGGRRTVVEDDLGVEDASRLSAEQWTKLSPQTKKRILGG